MCGNLHKMGSFFTEKSSIFVDGPIDPIVLMGILKINLMILLKNSLICNSIIRIEYTHQNIKNTVFLENQLTRL
jgi:hypothetical protein